MKSSSNHFKKNLKYYKINTCNREGRKSRWLWNIAYQYIHCLIAFDNRAIGILKNMFFLSSVVVSNACLVNLTTIEYTDLTGRYANTF
jgi:hypothetical protein